MISVLVTHHKPDLEPYLLAALESLRRQKGVEFRGHLISSTKLSGAVTDFILGCEGIIDAHERYDLDSPSKKVDFWLDTMVGDAEFTMMLSNDVVLSDNCLSEMSKVQGDCIQTALSNNEHRFRYFSDIPFPEWNYDIGEVDLEKAYSVKTPFSGLLIKAPHISFYAPFIKKTVWDKVGRLDPRFDKKYNDTDFCYRAFLNKIPSVINAGCHALHFGSKTTKSYMCSQEEQEIDKIWYSTYSMYDLFQMMG